MRIVKLLLLVFSIILISCKSDRENELLSDSKQISIKNSEVLKDDLILNGNQGLWYYKEQPYSGYAVRYYPNDTLMQKVGFYNGKKEGVAKVWFENGVLKMESNYNQNTLVGSYKSWWENGKLASESTYIDGKLNGFEKRWYDSGVLAKQRNFVDGQENGIQQAWLKNGKLYVNYEAKNGRVFGMRRANSCYKLENEVVIRTK